MKNRKKSLLLYILVAISFSCGNPPGPGPALSNAKAIMAFSFAAPPVTCTIDENAKTISVTVPFGTVVTAMVATFTTNGASVTINSVAQESGVTANDFTGQVVYKVTAADGSSVNYSVIVTIQPWHVLGNAGFSSKAIYYFSFAIDPSSGTPYIAYSDLGWSGKATVMKFTSGSWKAVGSEGFSSDVVSPSISLAINSSGIPYVAFQDATNSGKITVMDFVSNSWQIVGTAGFSDGIADSISLAINSSAIPYVGYQDASHTQKLTVQKFTAGSWQLVGPTSISSGYVRYVSLAFDSSSTAYVGYQDGSGGQATVKQFTAGSWQNVGSAGFSPYGAINIALKIDTADTPYIGYYSNSGAEVMKYATGSWQIVGSSPAVIGVSTSLGLDSTGMPYIVNSGGGATVSKFKDGSWQVHGLGVFYPGDVSLAILAIDSSNTVYVAFQDGANGLKATVMQYN